MKDLLMFFFLLVKFDWLEIFNFIIIKIFENISFRWNDIYDCLISLLRDKVFLII